ncbi:hypothetical protein J6590_000540 [Homalodisca vitripennis]|nr:hypothetical protein J6590_000540 [Homalodisca vitripennis]
MRREPLSPRVTPGQTIDTVSDYVEVTSTSHDLISTPSLTPQLSKNDVSVYLPLDVKREMGTKINELSLGGNEKPTLYSSRLGSVPDQTEPGEECQHLAVKDPNKGRSHGQTHLGINIS